MILLLGFKNYEDHDCEYQVTGDDLLRLAALIGHAVKVNGHWAHVTFYCEDLDNAFTDERVQGRAGTEGHSGSTQADIFDRS